MTREMVTPAQRKSLTKEGYRIIGSHSAVKICRWTKNHLRGRGVRARTACTFT
jgi:tRNA wybutosine-synthesizing protein 1